ncbi:hypothetical protein EV143_10223 [Flavobacterium chryseum]|nr:hypothetical protein EV143_10223 [Flavobacterium sp. P3160]
MLKNFNIPISFALKIATLSILSLDFYLLK